MERNKQILALGSSTLPCKSGAPRSYPASRPPFPPFLSFPFLSFPFLSRSRLICSISAGKMTPSIGKMSTPSSPTFAGANLIHLHCRPLYPLHPLHPLRRLPSRGHWRRHNRPIKDAFVRIRLPTLVYYSCLSADSGTPTG